jgi:hypothetical protein
LPLTLLLTLIVILISTGKGTASAVPQSIAKYSGFSR